MSLVASSSALGSIADPDEPRPSRDIGAMRTKIGRNRPTQSQLRQETRDRVATLVAGHEVRAGRMQAYVIVGRIIGRTGDWVRKLVAGRPVAVLAADYTAAAEAHLSFLDRQAARALTEQRRAEAAMEEWNAIRQGVSGAGDRDGGAPVGGNGSRRRPVAP